jgi:ribosomal protein S18 acetylase RimI-like enzyme
MGIVYFRRYRMEYDLREPLFPQPRMPDSYRLVAWDERLLQTHAEVKFQCFRHEMDASVFPALGEQAGCHRLMSEIAGRSGFVPEATWLLEYWPPDARRPEVCGTIQGVSDDRIGAIQNVGITPAHRGRGLGTLLMWHSLLGFQRTGTERVFLEVTAQNQGACRLYERLGFKQTKVVYKAPDIAYSEW